MSNYKRWYDYDPLLMEVIELLRCYQDELKTQAEIFLQKIEAQVSKETIDRFYEMVKPVNGGNRWYDKDPVLSKTIELLRVVPPDVQKKAAQSFLNSIEEMGLSRDVAKKSEK
jgi:hypothetical protein